MKSEKLTRIVGSECLAIHDENIILVISNDQLISLSEVASDIKIEQCGVCSQEYCEEESLGWQHKSVHH